ncbi:MAG: hypothetical protein K2Q18_13190 [Bdellovibrionales bacterium]|nr:hypothetical protein [Bdellovibrionales bacterium]
MKWLILLFSVFKPFFSTGESTSMINPIAELKDMIKANAVKVVLLFSCASAMSTMFAAGVVIVAVDMGAQYDQNAYVYFSSMISMGLVLMFIPILIGAIGIRIFQSDDRKQKEREVLTSVGTSHPLQDALALLIHDFVKERELKRSAEETAYQGPIYADDSPEIRTRAESPRH